MRKIIALLGALLAWLAVGLQFYMAIPLWLGQGMTIAEALLQFFSYFTILTNILVGLTYTLTLVATQSSVSQFFQKVSVRSAVTLYIVIVGLVYNLVLRNVWHPEGWMKVGNELLHSVNPLLFLVFWLICVPKGKLNWTNIFYWLVYPILYLPFVLIKGAFTGNYPYPFIHVGELGYMQVLLNSLILLVVFAFMGFILVQVDRLLGQQINREKSHD